MEGCSQCGRDEQGLICSECQNGINEIASLKNDREQDDCSDYEDSDNTSVYSENSELHANEVSAAVLKNAKRALVNQLMQEVWDRLDKDWAEKFNPCTGSASTSAQGTVQKRHREEDDDNSSSDDHGRAPKRSIPQQTFSLPFAMYCVSPDVQDYYGYVRRELPRLVRSHLESTVNLQFQTLASALDEIIQGCMDQLLIVMKLPGNAHKAEPDRLTSGGQDIG